MGCPLSVPWDEASPSGATTPADTIDTELQNLKISIRERLEDLIPDWSDDTVCPKVLAGGNIGGLFGKKRALFTADGAGAISAVFQSVTDIVDFYYIRVNATLGTGLSTISVNLLDIDSTITGTGLAIIGRATTEWSNIDLDAYYIDASATGLTFSFRPKDLFGTIEAAAGGTVADKPLENISATFEFWVAVLDDVVCP